VAEQPILSVTTGVDNLAGGLKNGVRGRLSLTTAVIVAPFCRRRCANPRQCRRRHRASPKAIKYSDTADGWNGADCGQHSTSKIGWRQAHRFFIAKGQVDTADGGRDPALRQIPVNLNSPACGPRVARTSPLPSTSPASTICALSFGAVGTAISVLRTYRIHC